MRRYSETVKADIRKRMSPPAPQSVARISEETGIHICTLYAWRKGWRLGGEVVPASQKDPEGWSAAEKFTVVLESAGLNATELNAYCRERGLYPEQVERWQQASQDANEKPVLTLKEQRELEKLRVQDPGRSNGSRRSCARRRKPWPRRRRCCWSQKIVRASARIASRNTKALQTLAARRHGSSQSSVREAVQTPKIFWRFNPDKERGARQQTMIALVTGKSFVKVSLIPIRKTFQFLCSPGWPPPHKRSKIYGIKIRAEQRLIAQSPDSQSTFSRS